MKLKPASRSSDTRARRAVCTLRSGLRALSIATVVAIAAALALVFFYAPLEAEQGFLQKIFYVHVPLAIVALCGFVLGGLLAIQHLRTRDSRWDMRSYVAIHMSLIFAVGDADHRLDLGEGLVGALVGVERADARVVPDRVPAVRDLPAAALRDRGPRAPGALRVGVRDHRRRVRADELHRRAPLDRLPAPARARQHLEPAGPMALTFLVSLVAMALLFATLCKYELTAKHTRAQLRALRRRARAAAHEPRRAATRPPAQRSAAAAAAPPPRWRARRAKDGRLMAARALLARAAGAAAAHGRQVRRRRLRRAVRARADLRRDHGDPPEPHRARAGRAAGASEQRAPSARGARGRPVDGSRRRHERAAGARHLAQDGARWRCASASRSPSARRSSSRSRPTASDRGARGGRDLDLQPHRGLPRRRATRCAPSPTCSGCSPAAPASARPSWPRRSTRRATATPRASCTA